MLICQPSTQETSSVEILLRAEQHILNKIIADQKNFVVRTSIKNAINRIPKKAVATLLSFLSTFFIILITGNVKRMDPHKPTSTSDAI